MCLVVVTTSSFVATIGKIFLPRRRTASYSRRSLRRRSYDSMLADETIPAALAAIAGAACAGRLPFALRIDRATQVGQSRFAADGGAS